MQDFSQFNPMDFSMWAHPDNSIAYQQPHAKPTDDARLQQLGQLEIPGVADPIPSAPPQVPALQAHAAPLPDAPHSLWNPTAPTYQHSPWLRTLLDFPGPGDQR